jgi:hypothetical protein
VRNRILLSLSVLSLLAGAWVLNGACAFAMLNMPLPDQLATYRAVFYQRASVGIGCILAGILLLRLRREPAGPKSAAEGQSTVSEKVVDDRAAEQADAADKVRAGNERRGPRR